AIVLILLVILFFVFTILNIGNGIFVRPL
ncbi:MAG: hypothetical protein RL498_468, partial [Pseudomonadota bacterium]